MGENRFLESLAKAGQSFDIHYKGTAVENTTTLRPDAQFPGYVEWYWVILGLVIPILLGSLFCILDHFRRRKGARRYTERRLERLCERNKVEPPSYEASAVHINECAATDHATIQRIDSNSLPCTSSVKNTSTILQTLPQTTINHKTMNGPASTPCQVGGAGVGEIAVSSAASEVAMLSSNDSEFMPTEMPISVTPTNTRISEDAQNDLDEVDLEECPPSYEEYHLYEVHGSTTQLV